MKFDVLVELGEHTRWVHRLAETEGQAKRKATTKGWVGIDSTHCRGGERCLVMHPTPELEAELAAE